MESLQIPQPFLKRVIVKMMILTTAMTIAIKTAARRLIRKKSLPRIGERLSQQHQKPDRPLMVILMVLEKVQVGAPRAPAQPAR